MPTRTVHTWERAAFMAADQPEQPQTPSSQPMFSQPMFSQPPYESSSTAGPIDPADSLDPDCSSDSSSAPYDRDGLFGAGCEPSDLAAEAQDDQDNIAALVAEARAQGPLPGPRPDPQRVHRPPSLPHLPDVERDEVDAIIGRVLAESTGW